MTLKVSSLVKNMLTAAKTTFSEDWPEIKDHAKTELKAIAESIALIERLRIQKKITQKQAKLLIKMKKNTTKILLLTSKGLTEAAAEKAIKSALDTVKDTVNNALNFKLL